MKKNSSKQKTKWKIRCLSVVIWKKNNDDNSWASSFWNTDNYSKLN